jgi:DNA polymerase-3 subunit epsilon
MNLHIDKDLIFLDIEATGLHVIRDRIIQLAMIKFSPGVKEPQERNWLINPGIPISEEAMKVHGILPADVARKPIFRQLAAEIFEFIGNADFAGYHSNQFDIPILMEELARAGFELTMDGRHLVDVQRIFYKMEPRTLSAAYRYYCKAEIGEIHDAMQDVKATIAVLDGQLKMYENKDLVTEEGEVISNPVKNDILALHDFTNDLRLVDATQKLKYDVNGEIVFNFGIYRDQNVAKVLTEDKQYYHWMLNKEFSFQVKQIIRKLVADYEKNQKPKVS